MPKHWSERLACSCGKSFRSYAEEARHRHNFPALCRGNEKKLVEAMGNYLLEQMKNNDPRFTMEGVTPEEMREDGERMAASLRAAHRNKLTKSKEQNG